jgi:hypothetical protein
LSIITKLMDAGLHPQESAYTPLSGTPRDYYVTIRDAGQPGIPKLTGVTSQVGLVLTAVNWDDIVLQTPKVGVYTLTFHSDGPPTFSGEEGFATQLFVANLTVTITYGKVVTASVVMTPNVPIQSIASTALNPVVVTGIDGGGNAPAVISVPSSCTAYFNESSGSYPLLGPAATPPVTGHVGATMATATTKATYGSLSVAAPLAKRYFLFVRCTAYDSSFPLPYTTVDFVHGLAVALGVDGAAAHAAKVYLSAIAFTLDDIRIKVVDIGGNTVESDNGRPISAESLPAEPLSGTQLVGLSVNGSHIYSGLTWNALPAGIHYVNFSSPGLPILHLPMRTATSRAPLDPSSPVIVVSGFAFSGTVVVTWTIPTVAIRGNLPVLAYEILRDGLLIAPPTSALSITDPSPLFENTAYTYALRFNTSLGQSPLSAGVTVVTPYRAPVLTSVSPSIVPPNGASTLTVSGSFFGVTASDLLAVYVDGANVTAYTWSAPTTAVVTGASTAIVPGSSSSVQVATVHGVSSHVNVSIGFPPIVSAVSPEWTTSVMGGINVEIAGDHFGVAASDLLSVSLAGVPCSSVTRHNASALTCISGPSSSTNTTGFVAVTTGSGGTSAGLSFSYVALSPIPLSNGTNETSTAPTPATSPAPSSTPLGGVRIDSIHPPQGSTSGGYDVDLAGDFQALTPRQVVSIAIGTAVCGRSLYRNATSLVCVKVPPGAGAATTSLNLRDGTAVAGPSFTYLQPAPVVFDVKPRLVSASTGARITIRGDPFTDGSYVVMVGDSACTAVIRVSTTFLTCDVAPSLAKAIDVPLVVSIDALSSVPTRISILTGTAGFRFGDVTCDPSCDFGNICNDVTGLCPSCVPGFTGAPRCVTPSLQLSVDSKVLSEGASTTARVSFAEPPDRGPLTIELRSNTPSQISFSPARTIVDTSNWNRPSEFAVFALVDGARDGNVSVVVTAHVVAGVGRFADSRQVPDARMELHDSVPMIVSFAPKVVPLAGRVNLTVTITDQDSWVAIRLGDIFVTETRPRSTRQSGGTSGTVALALAADHLPNSTSYLRLSVENSVTGTWHWIDNELYTTDDCPVAGEFGRGKDCKVCPEGGECPGV